MNTKEISDLIPESPYTIEGDYITTKTGKVIAQHCNGKIHIKQRYLKRCQKLATKIFNSKYFIIHNKHCPNHIWGY